MSMRRGRFESLQRTSFGNWIRNKVTRISFKPSIDKVIDCLTTDVQKQAITCFEQDPLLKFLFAPKSGFNLIVPDSPIRGLSRIQVGEYSYGRDINVSWEWLTEHFGTEVALAKTHEVIKETVSKLNEALLELGEIRPLQHIYWTWPLAAQECFTGIPKPIRMRKGAVRDFYVGDKLFSAMKEELEQDLQKLMLVYSASIERGTDA